MFLTTPHKKPRIPFQFFSDDDSNMGQKLTRQPCLYLADDVPATEMVSRFWVQNGTLMPAGGAQISYLTD